ncbi:hypothetical protein Lal_00033959 [Lupinus albus]|nr:hypothetical protein Lal_00033959 [Lupinus albus]
MIYYNLPLKDGGQRHTFHLPYDECTITLEDVSLQIGVNGKYPIHYRSRGSACLANLYIEMCWATKPNAKAMGECFLFLQSWAWYRLPFLALRVDGLPTYSFASS